MRVEVLISLLYFVGLSNGIVALAVGLPVFIALVAVLIDGLVHLPAHAAWPGFCKPPESSVGVGRSHVSCVCFALNAQSCGWLGLFLPFWLGGWAGLNS